MTQVTISQDIVAAAKKELFEKLKANIDLDRIREICADLYGIKNIDALDFKDGDIVVHDRQVAYKMAFDICFTVPLLIDEEGNLIGTSAEEKTEADTPEGRVEEIGQQTGEIAQGF